ncbi:hypothetical protein NXC12_CH02413 [Rhizobium etli]|uniref:Uncharacterized protein n=1 Tax=Rhizobium etli TaxID=29449 RepID=A0AAN1BFR5_RHIET|nr:hypothetical protein NXC12_CH02413 [Rhizobium etli]
MGHPYGCLARAQRLHLTLILAGVEPLVSTHPADPRKRGDGRALLGTERFGMVPSPV